MKSNISHRGHPGLEELRGGHTGSVVGDVQVAKKSKAQKVKVRDLVEAMELTDAEEEDTDWQPRRPGKRRLIVQDEESEDER